MTPDGASLASFPTIVAVMCTLAGLASLVNAIELLWLCGAGTVARVWAGAPLAAEWGILRPLMGRRAFTVMLLVHSAAAIILMIRHAAPAAALLVATTYLTAVRFRGNVNGGSDAMLFTVLGGLAIARSDSASLFWREAGVLYVAAQLTLSYLRAGLAKARHRSWWTGEAMRSFMALPAYGVPAIARLTRPSLRLTSVAVILFECASPLAMLNAAACAAYIGLAFSFHATTAMIFGLNRFFLAWIAALPSLWYAVHRAM